MNCACTSNDIKINKVFLVKWIGIQHNLTPTDCAKQASIAHHAFMLVAEICGGKPARYNHTTPCLTSLSLVHTIASSLCINLLN